MEDVVVKKEDNSGTMSSAMRLVFEDDNFIDTINNECISSDNARLRDNATCKDLLKNTVASCTTVTEHVTETQNIIKCEIFKCTLCFEDFTQEIEYNLHMIIHHQNGDSNAAYDEYQVCESQSAVGCSLDSPVVKNETGFQRLNDDFPSVTLAPDLVSFAYTFTGAVVTWPSPAIPKFKNGEAGITISDAQSSWVVSLLPLGALPGCYLGKVLSERAGRRLTIYSAAVPGFLGASIILFTKSPELMYFARVLIGIANGITAVVTMIYLTEIADKEIRGALGMLVQVMNNLGSLAVYGIGPFVSYTVLNSMVLFLSVFYAVICLWVPESPYYHLSYGRLAAAKKEFMTIKGTKDEVWVDEQINVMRRHVQESMENKTTFAELVTNTKYRKAIYIISGLKVLQYMTGSLAIQAYLEIIFRQSSSISGPYASIVYGFVQLGAGIGATFLAGYFGRRVLMLTSSFGVAVSLTIVGLYFFLQDYMHVGPGTLSSISAMPLVGVLGFNILYAAGIGNLPYVMQAELFPLNVKTTASSAATMMACILNFFVTKSYQGIKDGFGHFTVFWSFASIAYAGILFIYFYVPETKGKSLEEVQDNMRIENEDAEALKKSEIS
ncbi:facilitated trehalose transporter Tret1 isoform X3 [Bicyclus anynana]|uniref:Facilitated trehalose transporter Tret1 isoform X3 n=1 Tax=Bicyclus anynana TaxID=110368 RepID=A0ABM3LM00_BICAN|nr:facilitated trehalose transporter Tret1 isoform X3 [Bicyclus anynana]